MEIKELGNYFNEQLTMEKLIKAFSTKMKAYIKTETLKGIPESDIDSTKFNRIIDNRYNDHEKVATSFLEALDAITDFSLVVQPRVQEGVQEGETYTISIIPTEKGHPYLSEYQRDKDVAILLTYLGLVANNSSNDSGWDKEQLAHFDLVNLYKTQCLATRINEFYIHLNPKDETDRIYLPGNGFVTDEKKNKLLTKEFYERAIATLTKLEELVAPRLKLTINPID